MDLLGIRDRAKDEAKRTYLTARTMVLEPEIKQLQTTERGKAAERKQKLGSMGERLCYGMNGIMISKIILKMQRGTVAGLDCSELTTKITWPRS